MNELIKKSDLHWCSTKLIVFILLQIVMINITTVSVSSFISSSSNLKKNELKLDVISNYDSNKWEEKSGASVPNSEHFISHKRIKIKNYRKVNQSNIAYAVEKNEKAKATTHNNISNSLLYFEFFRVG